MYELGIKLPSKLNSVFGSVLLVDVRRAKSKHEYANSKIQMHALLVSGTASASVLSEHTFTGARTTVEAGVALRSKRTQTANMPRVSSSSGKENNLRPTITTSLPPLVLFIARSFSQAFGYN